MKIFSRQSYPLIIIVAGICFSLYLQFLLPQDTYFNGDAGLKSLLAQQFASGNLNVDLQQTSLDWVHRLWREGFYPYKEPFAYYLDRKYYITFPYTFPLVTAPFYALFGYRGLYVIPLVCTWAVWLLFYLACVRSRLNNFLTSLGLILLIFASPLTLYSAMYWEHTLSVLLCFLGLFLWFFPKEKERVSKFNSILAGVAIGLSVWFRPEFLPLVLSVVGLVVFLKLLSRSKLSQLNNQLSSNDWQYLTRNYLFFLSSLITTVALFFICNKLIYHHPLGIHAMQIVEKTSLSQRLGDAWGKLQQLILFLFEYYPVTYFLLVYPIISLIAVDRSNRRRNFILTATYLSLCGLIILFFWLTNNRFSEFIVTYLPLLCLPILYGILLVINYRKIEFNLAIVLFYLLSFAFIVGVALLVPAGTEGFKVVGGKQWGARFLLILIPIFSLFAIHLISQLSTEKYDKICRYGTIAIMGIILALGISKNTFAASAYLDREHQGYLPAIAYLSKQDKDDIIITSYQFVGQILEPALHRKKIFFLAETSQDLTKLAAGLAAENKRDFLYICYPKRKCLPPEEKAEKLQFQQDDRRFQIILSSQGKQGIYPIYQGEIREIKSNLIN
jgi:hypothetical protein